MWAIKEKHGKEPARCEIYLITLALSSNSADAKLKEEAVQLLQVSQYSYRQSSMHTAAGYWMTDQQLLFQTTAKPYKALTC